MHHDLLIVCKPFSINDPHRGRRDLRPGTAVNIEDGAQVDDLIRRGYLRRISESAPLFAESTENSAKPMRKRKD